LNGEDGNEVKKQKKLGKEKKLGKSILERPQNTKGILSLGGVLLFSLLSFPVLEVLLLWFVKGFGFGWWNG